MPDADGPKWEERHIQVRVFRVHLYCKACGGEVARTVRVFDTDPPSYEQACGGCGALIVESREYPYTEYEYPEDGRRAASLP